MAKKNKRDELSEEIDVTIEETVDVEETPAKKAPKVKESKSKKTKANFFVRTGRKIKKFWKEYWSELKKVSWMSWKDIRKNTLLVVVTVVAFSVAIGLVDTAFGKIIDGFAGMVG